MEGIKQRRERRYRVRCKGVPVTSARRAIAIAAIALLGSMLECVAAPAQKNVTAPTPPLRPSKPSQQEQVRPPSSRGTDADETARALGATNAGGSKSRAAPQAETIAPKQTASPGGTSAPSLPGSEAALPALPAASRARMRDCGHEWQDMKRTGQAKELTWRDFAMKCLTR